MFKTTDAILNVVCSALIILAGYVFGFALGLFLLAGCAPQKGDVGEAGSQGPAGLQGAVGPQGPAGEVGPQGPAGVQVVPLCPGETTYPTTAIEVAFCIDNHLYATYSTHGGFSAELVPGVYSSNTEGSQCTFTVVEACEISNAN